MVFQDDAWRSPRRPHVKEVYNRVFSAHDGPPVRSCWQTVGLLIPRPDSIQGPQKVRQMPNGIQRRKRSWPWPDVVRRSGAIHSQIPSDPSPPYLKPCFACHPCSKAKPWQWMPVASAQPESAEKSQSQTRRAWSSSANEQAAGLDPTDLRRRDMRQRWWSLEIGGVLSSAPAPRVPIRYYCLHYQIVEKIHLRGTRYCLVPSAPATFQCHVASSFARAPDQRQAGFVVSGRR